MSDKEYVSVRDVITSRVESIDGLASVSEALEYMREHEIGALIIEKRGDFDEYGMVTLRNIATQVIEPNRSPDRTSVYEIMDKPALGLDVEMNIRYAIRFLTQYHLFHAIALDNGKAVGIVTLRDMVLSYMKSNS